MKWLRAMGMGAVALLAMAASALAQTCPNQPVRIVVPFSAGSVTDILARVLSDELSKMWGQQVIVENRPGVPGTTSVANAPADGYTLMVTSNGHTVVGVMNKNLQFDPVKNFSGITQLASVPLAMIVPPDLPANSVGEFIALAKAKPGTLNFASPGLGSSTFIAGAMFKQAANIDIVHVAYKGAPEAITSVVRGDAHVYFAPINVSSELIEAKKVRALATVTPQRVPQLKDVPTFAEAGLPTFTYDSWFGLMAPANVPTAVREKVSKDAAQVMQNPEIRKRLEAQGVAVTLNKPAEFDKIIADDTDRLTKLFRDAGVAVN